jgi:hypothetical protein
MRASPIACSRARGSLARQRVTSRRQLGGSEDGSADQSGSSRITAASVSETVSPANARLPDSISNSTTPNAQMSARRSASRPRACSGT